jgi:hypothetical protein
MTRCKNAWPLLSVRFAEQGEKMPATLGLELNSISRIESNAILRMTQLPGRLNAGQIDNEDNQ